MKILRNPSWALLAAAIVCWSGCSSSGGGGGGGVATVVQGSGIVIDESRAVSGFTRVSYASEGAVHVTQGAVESLRIRADDNLLQYLTSSVQGGTLSLSTGSNVDVRPTQTIEWFLTVKSLEDIRVGGIGSVDVSGLTTNRLALTCTGISNVVFSNLSATELDVDAGGIGTVRASGTVDRQFVTLPAFGFGDYEAESLQSREAHVSVHGQADATVRVSDLLRATITSSGSVYYIGSPTVDATITGTGQVVQLAPSSPRMHPVLQLWIAGAQPLVIWDPVSRGARSPG